MSVRVRVHARARARPVERRNKVKETEKWSVICLLPTRLFTWSLVKCSDLLNFELLNWKKRREKKKLDDGGKNCVSSNKLVSLEGIEFYEIFEATSQSSNMFETCVYNNCIAWLGVFQIESKFNYTSHSQTFNNRKFPNKNQFSTTSIEKWENKKSLNHSNRLICLSCWTVTMPVYRRLDFSRLK